MRKKERFLVLELFRHGIRATTIRVDTEGRLLRVGAPTAAKSGESLVAFAKRLGKLSRMNVVVSCDAALAATVQGNIVVPNEGGGVLDEAAVEHIVAQSIWKLFDGERSVAAKRLGVSTDELVLADARVWRVALDGRVMLNPLGYAAKNVEVRLSVTMMPRAQHALLTAAFPLGIALMSESGVSWARVLQSTTADDAPFLVAGLFPEHAVVVVADDGIRYVDAFEWGEQQLISGVAVQLAVTHDIARYVIGAARDGAKTSPLFTRKVGDIVAAELQLLVNGLQTVAGKLPARKCLVVPFYDVTSVLLSIPIKNMSRRLAKVLFVSAEDISKNFGFAIQWKVSEPAYVSLGAVMSFFDAYIAPKFQTLNAIARRRVRWLQSGTPAANANEREQ